MTCFALPAKCGCLRDSGLSLFVAAACVSRSSMVVRAIAPRPTGHCLRKCRRVIAAARCIRKFMVSSLRKHLIQVQEDIADHGPGGEISQVRVFRGGAD